MRATNLAAGGLAVAGAAMTIAAFAGGGRAAPLPHTAADGVYVWVANGCGSCHTFKPAGATGTIGPDLQRALQGQSRSEVMKSIVAPGDTLMPGDFARRIAPQDLERLVDFILAGVHAQ
jgi:hypothetical protein